MKSQVRKESVREKSMNGSMANIVIILNIATEIVPSSDDNIVIRAN